MLAQDSLIKLLTDFPLLYKNNMYFEIDDGWFDLIYRLSKELEEGLKLIDLPLDHEEFPHVHQVKSKFGGLRFYFSGPAWMEEVVSRFESESEKICEMCGLPGVTRGRHWLVTACDTCFKKEMNA